MVVNNELLLQSIRIVGDVEADSSEPAPLRVVYPSQRRDNGNFRRCFYPSNAESREKFDKAIMDAYNKVLNGEVDGNTVSFLDSTDRPSYEVTRASVYQSSLSESTRAKVSVELDGELWLRGMMLVVRDDGSLFLRMPRRQAEGDRWMDYFHPLDQDARNHLTSGVIPFYEEAAASAPPRSWASSPRR